MKKIIMGSMVLAASAMVQAMVFIILAQGPAAQGGPLIEFKDFSGGTTVTNTGSYGTSGNGTVVTFADGSVTSTDGSTPAGGGDTAMQFNDTNTGSGYWKRESVHFSAPTLAGDWSFAFSIRRDGSQLTYDAVFCASNSAGVNGTVYSLFSDADTLRVGLFQAGVGERTAYIDLDDGKWTHVAVTYDEDGGNSGNGKISIYENGSAVYTNGYVNDSMAVLTTGALSLGARVDGYRPFKGAVDNFVIFSNSLSAVEVYALYQDAGTVSVNDYGVVGDGATDNSADLIALRDALITLDRERHWTLLFDASAYPYQYTNNRWLNGLKRVSVKGYGATLQCTSSLAAGNDCKPFNGRCIMHDYGDEQYTGGTEAADFHTGHFIHSAARGDWGVYLVNAASNVYYQAGDKVFLHGLNTQNKGWSPNLRWYEWHTVSSVSSNYIQFAEQVQYDYSENWWDYDYCGDGRYITGKPRIINLNRPEYNYPEYVRIEGFSFLANTNPVSTEADDIAIPGRVVELINLVGDFPEFQIFVRETELTVISNCTIGGVIEIDKMCKDVIIENSHIKGGDGMDGDTTNTCENLQPHAIKSATGCDRLYIRNNVVNHRINVCPKYLNICSNAIDIVNRYGANEAIMFYNNTWGGYYADISSNSINRSASETDVSYEASTLVYNSIDSSDNSILCDLTGTYAGGYRIRGIFEGHSLYDQTQTNKIGTVTGFEERSGSIAVLVDWASVPTNGAAITYYNMRYVTYDGALFAKEPGQGVPAELNRLTPP